jgi:hypothetical protein
MADSDYEGGKAVYYRIRYGKVSCVEMTAFTIGGKGRRSIEISRGPLHKAEKRDYLRVTQSSWRRWRAVQDRMVTV